MFVCARERMLAIRYLTCSIEFHVNRNANATDCCVCTRDSFFRFSRCSGCSLSHYRKNRKFSCSFDSVQNAVNRLLFYCIGIALPLWHRFSIRFRLHFCERCTNDEYTKAFSWHEMENRALSIRSIELKNGEDLSPLTLTTHGRHRRSLTRFRIFCFWLCWNLFYLSSNVLLCFQCVTERHTLPFAMGFSFRSLSIASSCLSFLPLQNSASLQCVNIDYERKSVWRQTKENTCLNLLPDWHDHQINFQKYTTQMTHKYTREFCCIWICDSSELPFRCNANTIFFFSHNLTLATTATAHGIVQKTRKKKTPTWENKREKCSESLSSCNSIWRVVWTTESSWVCVV